MSISSDPISIGALSIRFHREGGDLALFECEVPAGARVPAPHSHDAFDETIYALSGTTTWTVDGEPRELRAGEALHIPRGVVHHFTNSGADHARFLAMATPGAIGPEYFREVGAAVGAGPEAVVDVMRRHGLSPVMEPVG